MHKMCANCANSDYIGTGMNDPLQFKVSGHIVGDFSLDCEGKDFILYVSRKVIEEENDNKTGQGSKKEQSRKEV